MLPCATTCPQAVCIFTQPMPRFHSGSLLQYQCKARTRQTSATKQTNKCSTYVIAEAHNSINSGQLTQLFSPAYAYPETSLFSNILHFNIVFEVLFFQR